MNKALLSAASVGVLALMLPAVANAGAFHLQEHSVRALGRAYSGEVADTGAASLWWNPASIARSDRELHVGAHAIFVDSRVSDTGSNLTRPPLAGGATTPVGGEPVADDPIESGVAPNFGIALPVGERLVVGFSFAAPFTFTSEYEPNSWARYDAIKSELFMIDLQGTVAVQVTDWLDIGGGVSAEYADATLTNALPNLSPALPDGLQELSGDGWDFGWTLGAQAHFDRIDFGLSYRSAVEHELEGNATVSGLLGPLAGSNFSGAGSANFTTPWMAHFGVRYRVTPQLTLNGQVSRFGWGEFDAIDVTTLAGETSIEQDYSDTTNFGFGADYEVNPGLTLRAGVQWDPTPTPENGRTARVPDSDRRLFTVGGSSQLRDNLGLDFALGYVDFEGGNITRDEVIFAGTPVATTHRLRGQGRGEGWILSAGARWGF